MIKVFLVLLGVGAGGGFGWWLGSSVGLMTAYFCGVFGASAGLYLSRRYVRNYLD